MNPGGTGAYGGSYSSTGDIIASNISYGTAHVFDNGGTGILIADGPYSWTLTDDQNPNCNRPLFLPIQPSCSPDPCPPEYTQSFGNRLTGIQVIDEYFETDGIIESDQVINANVDYDSGTQIDLLPGFEVQLGKIFHAFIDGCGNLFRDDTLKETKD